MPLSSPISDPAPSVRVALIGVGEFGRSFLFRSGRAPGLTVIGAADPDLNRVVDAALAAGFTQSAVRTCNTAIEAQQAAQAGQFVAVTDAALLMDLPLDFVVEATGEPDAAANVAIAAIDKKINVAMVSKECDSVIGPVLQERARQAGVVTTIVDGDQPSLAIALIRWARHLGLEVVCAGKASEYDFVVDLQTEQVTANGRQKAIPSVAATWSSNAADACEKIRTRAGLLGAWPHATTPDLCELGLIANATDLNPDCEALHAPIARTLELPNLFRPASEGGLLSRAGTLDIFNCLRRSDEISFAGGVFVVVRCDDERTWEVLRGKGIPISDDGRYGLLHNPVHLLGLEAPASLFNTMRSGQPAARFEQRYDLVARTTAPQTAGTRLSMDARHSIAGMQALLQPARPAGQDSPIPYYMAANQVLATDVPAGVMLTRQHVVEPEQSTLWTLRAEQDSRLAPEQST